MRDIKFIWAHKEYVVNLSAYDATYIVLPNKIVIQPTMWLESSPPKLGSATVVEHKFQHSNAGEIAQLMGNAVLAREFI